MSESSPCPRVLTDASPRLVMAIDAAATDRLKNDPETFLRDNFVKIKGYGTIWGGLHLESVRLRRVGGHWRIFYQDYADVKSSRAAPPAKVMGKDDRHEGHIRAYQFS